MPFNLQTFKTRSLTAVIFVAVMLIGLLWSQWSFLVLFSVIHFGCWIEYQKLVGLIDKDYQAISPVHQYGIMLAGWGFMLWMTDNSFSLGNLALNEIGGWILLACIVVVPLTEIVLRRKPNQRILGYTVGGFLYISMSWGLMMNLRSHMNTGFWGDKGWVLPLLIIVAIWINDTMAYIVGSLIGKTPFSPISPKKTWEGTIGGALLAVGTVTLAGHYVFYFDWIPLIAIATTAVVVGTAGDLLESRIKRMAGVKDSGQILPGHGGFLDRFDSLLLATPYVWLVLNLLLT